MKTYRVYLLKYSCFIVIADKRELNDSNFQKIIKFFSNKVEIYNFLADLQKAIREMFTNITINIDYMFGFDNKFMNKRP